MRRSLLRALAAALAVGLALAAVLYFVGLRIGGDEDSRKMPNLVGDPLASAVGRVHALGASAIVHHACGGAEQDCLGTVVGQNPEPGAGVPTGDPVELDAE